ncbi:MAG: hypothetical protein QM651_17255 [Rhodoblastus sp.]
MRHRRPATNAFAACVVAAGVFAPGVALACNPIQFLFGGCRPQPTPQPSLEQMIDRKHVPAPNARRKPVADAPVRGAKQAAIAPPQGASVGSVAHFAEDKTLRRGDVVVTPEGFLVYRGQGAAHSPTDFEPLTKARDDLASLQKASRNPRATYTAPADVSVKASADGAGLRVGRKPATDFEANVSR